MGEIRTLKMDFRSKYFLYKELVLIQNIFYIKS